MRIIASAAGDRSKGSSGTALTPASHDLTHRVGRDRERGLLRDRRSPRFRQDGEVVNLNPGRARFGAKQEGSIKCCPRVEFARTFASYGHCLLPHCATEGHDEARCERYRERGHFGCDPLGWRRRMPSPIAATPLRKPIARKPIPRKAAARFAARAFCARFRFPTRTVRKPRAVAASATIEPSRAGDKPQNRPNTAPITIPERAPLPLLP